MVPVMHKKGIDKSNISDEENIKDVKNIIEAIETLSQNRQESFLDELKQCYFLKVIKAETKEIYWCTPSGIYIYLTKIYTGEEYLEIYFEGNPAAYFLHDIYKEEFKREQLKKLGCLDEIKVNCKKQQMWDGHIQIADSYGYHVRGLNGFDPDFEIIGLEHALNNITFEK